MKRKTISQRWYKWNEVEPVWSYSALACFALAMAGLTIHLGLNGIFKTIGLVMLIGFDCGLLTITFLRRKVIGLWWFTFWLYVTIGVIGWEVASYFFGSQF